MTFDTHIDSDKQLRIHTASHVISIADIQTLLTHLLQQQDQSLNYDALWDFSQATLQLNNQDFEKLTSWIKQQSNKPEGGRVALVFPNDLGFGMGRMYEAHMSNMGRNFKVFRDTDAALKWLSD